MQVTYILPRIQSQKNTFVTSICSQFNVAFSLESGVQRASNLLRLVAIEAPALLKNQRANRPVLATNEPKDLTHTDCIQGSFC